MCVHTHTHTYINKGDFSFQNINRLIQIKTDLINALNTILHSLDDSKSTRWF